MNPVPPYNFGLSTKIFLSDGSICKFENNKNNKPVLIQLESTGTVDEPELQLILKSNDKISKKEGQIALETVNKLFNPDFNLDLFYECIKKDKIMSKMVQGQYGLKSTVTASVFEVEKDLQFFNHKNQRFLKQLY